MRRLARARAVYSLELAHTLARPLFWILVVLLALVSWLMSTGNMQISSGDTSVGGTKAWLTSEFSFAQLLIYLVTLLYAFFASIAAGTSILAEEEDKVGEVLHSTPLKPWEYVWGKFLAILTGFLAALALHLVFAAFFNHVVPNADAAEIRGPYEAVNYLRPAVIFGFPALVFFLGLSFYLGERWRRPVTVFLFPVAVLLVCAFFLWDWAPTWLDPKINRALMLVDPSGFRWLNETWLKLDRGARFYNTARIGLDASFEISRIVFLSAGLLGVALAQRHLTRTLRGSAVPEERRRWLGGLSPRRLWRRRRPQAPALEGLAPLAAAGARPGEIGFLRGSLLVARTEVRNILSSPALYLFSVLILLQTLGSSLLNLGAFQTFLLLTPGQLAVGTTGPLSFLVCVLLMFYTTESIERDERSGFSSVAYATPLRTTSLLFGKTLANATVGVFVIAATFIGCAIALLVQGKVSLDLGPFLLVWGGLLLPTFLLWTSFVTAVRAVTGDRYATYGIALSALALTIYRFVTNGMNWVGNWPLWGALRWSDMGAYLELNGRALLLSRVLALGLTALFTAVAVHAFRRRQPDSIGTLQRFSPRSVRRQILRFSPFAVVPLVAAVSLWLAVQNGFQGDAYRKKGRDYWKQNLATWLDAPQPAIAAVDLDLRFRPERRWFSNRGTYELLNDREEALSRFALTGGPHWKDVHWTLNGRPYEPENRSGLYVFTPPSPFPPGGRLRVGFQLEGTFPEGITENGGGTEELILPSGVVLTSFRPTFTPFIGYVKEMGIEKDENDYEPRDYPPDFYKGKTDAGFGLNRSFSTRIRITGPAEYTFNSVGAKVSEAVRDGERTVVWKSDRPVRFFNVVAGRWEVRKGQGTAIYYHPGHRYNIDEMIAALDASRRWYSQWFHPFPWQELKLSEFPNLASYAQGFPTNITFSEGIGFLTKSDVKTDAVFLVTAHEAAHQWWGNLLTPGDGPGGNLLSEGMSHFSTMLLIEQVKGPQARMEFAKRIEESYGDNRRVDAERSLVRIDGSREGDQTVTYDKGGWVFWMLHRHLGRERALAGLRKFIVDWGDKPDHPVLQDFTAAMRPFASDPAAYDAFVKQWFHEVVVPEYRLSEARKAKSGTGWEATVRIENAGAGRMPVEVAAIRGERFTEDGKPGAGYRESRQTVTLGAGEAKTLRIACPFEPEKVVVDPDVQVLQLRRKAAVAEL